MTGLPLIIAFVAAIVIMIIMISKLRIHPFISIMLVSLALGLVAGIPLVDHKLADGTVQHGLATVVGQGFSGTFTSIGIVIILGAMIGTVLEKTGGALKLADMMIRLVGKDNPVIVQMLGICSALAVTVKLQPALVMAISVTAVVAFANVIISLLRKTIPNRIRIIIQLVVVAALVTIVNEILKAFAYDVSKQLSVYVGLIITNCILMGRLEAFALGNKPWESFLDGVGNGAGYGIILVVVAFVRELFGSGTLLGFRIIPQAVYDAGYVNNGLMIMPPMALILCAVIVWIHRARNKDLQEK